MAVRPSIPPTENQCSRVQHTRRSRIHKSLIRGEAALMCPARWRSRPLVYAHIPCVAPTSLLDRALLPLRLKKKSCVMPIGAMFYTPGIECALSGRRPPCTSSILRYRCGKITVIQPAPLHLIVHIAGATSPAVAAPPRAAALHGRRRRGLHEPHCRSALRGRAPVHFQVCSPLTFHTRP